MVVFLYEIIIITLSSSIKKELANNSFPNNVHAGGINLD